MKRRDNITALIAIAAAFILAAPTYFSAQVINEIEIDPPSAISDACQYVEIRDTSGATVPANTYFLSVNSDSGNFGFANQAVNFGGTMVGSNGTIILFNTSFGECPNRTYGSGTTRLNYFNPLRVGTGSETYLIVRSTGTLFSGQDLDTNNDGIFDAALGITVIDGFALIVNPEEEFVYGAAAGVVNISNTTSLDQPDAVTRFSTNLTPFSATAFFYGELAATPDESLVYVAPFSANFPVGSVLTPGLPFVTSAAEVKVSGRVLNGAGQGLRNADVILTDANGTSRTVRSGSFGYYQFNSVEAGQTYVVTVRSKRYRFTSRVVSVFDSLSELNFNAEQ